MISGVDKPSNFFPVSWHESIAIATTIVYMYRCCNRTISAKSVRLDAAEVLRNVNLLIDMSIGTRVNIECRCLAKRKVATTIHEKL